jgi:hypothetical protein
MTHITPDNLRTTIATARQHAAWKIIMGSIGASVPLAQKWADRSKLASEQNLGKASDMYVDYDGEWAYWHQHIQRAKKIFNEHFSRLVLEQCAHDRSEVVLDASTLQPVQRRLPPYAHYSRERCEAEGLDYDRDIWEWELDWTGEPDYSRPVYVTRVVRASAHLVIRALAAQMPRTWSEKTQTDVQVSGHVVHQMQVPKFVPRAERLTQERGDIVDASFTEVESRKDIVELHAQASRLLSDPNRITRPDSAVKMGDGTPLNNRRAAEDSKPSTEDGSGRPRPGATVAADRPTPKGPAERPPIPQPPYARRSSLDAARTDSRGGNLNRSIKR